MNNPLVVVPQKPQDQNKVPHNLHQKIISVAELLSVTSLTIPEYQRPYKWDQNNLASLFNDIKTQCDKPAYRLGTIVLHKSKDKDDKDILNIVDGQQRTLTLMLTVMAIIKNYHADNSTKPTEAKAIGKILGELSNTVPALAKKQAFSSDISIYNLHSNFQEILRIISRGELSIEHIDFLLHQCEVVIFILEDESEAFQFFDSQNSRGKELYPHDLLKAFHLREFDTDDQILKAKTVAYWESLDDDKLAKLFAEYLFRIKHWSQSKPARSFTKHHIDVFKGINLDRGNLPPYAQSLLITHQYIEHYNASPHRYIDRQVMSYPFQLDQTIINGQRFFERVQHYHTLIDQIKQVSIHNATQSNIKDSICRAIDDSDGCCSVSLYNQTLNKRASTIVHTLNTYNNRHRQGDKYIRNLFDNTLIYYIDKFGVQDLSQAVEIIFIWAYQVRLTEYAVRLATMDNHAKTSSGLFRYIQQATLSKDVLVKSIPSLKYNEIDKNNRPEKDDNEIIGYELYRLFEHLNYVMKEV